MDHKIEKELAELADKQSWGYEELEEITEEFLYAGIPHDNYYNARDEIEYAESCQEVQDILDREHLSVQNYTAERDLQDLLDSHPNSCYL